MKRFTITLILLACISCKEIKFENPQPEGKRVLTSIPRNLRGKFLPMEGNAQPSKDTVIIHETGYRFGLYDSADRVREKDPFDAGGLSDTLVLKYYKGYYFFNFKSSEGWQVRVIKPEKNGDLAFMDMGKEGVGFDDYLRQLNTEVNVDSFSVNDNMVYRIDPTPSQLVNLIKKGFFSKVTPLIKVE